MDVLNDVDSEEAAWTAVNIGDAEAEANNVGYAWSGEQEPCLSASIADGYTNLIAETLFQGTYLLVEKENGAAYGEDMTIVESLGGGYYASYQDLNWSS